MGNHGVRVIHHDGVHAQRPPHVATHVAAIAFARGTLDDGAQQVVAIAGVAEARARFGDQVELLEDGDGLARILVLLEVLLRLAVAVGVDAAQVAQQLAHRHGKRFDREIRHIRLHGRIQVDLALFHQLQDGHRRHGLGDGREPVTGPGRGRYAVFQVRIAIAFDPFHTALAEPDGHARDAGLVHALGHPAVEVGQARGQRQGGNSSGSALRHAAEQRQRAGETSLALHSHDSMVRAVSTARR
ncbi:hypothetical protein D3C85_718720 [compost metagenome]